MKEGTTHIVPAASDCASASVSHCWAGIGNTMRTATWSLDINGRAMNVSRPIQTLTGSTIGMAGYYSIDSTQVEVLIDESVVQIFFKCVLTCQPLAVSLLSCTSH
jgi:hypothetical protein